MPNLSLRSHHVSKTATRTQLGPNLPESSLHRDDLGCFFFSRGHPSSDTQNMLAINSSDFWRLFVWGQTPVNNSFRLRRARRVQKKYIRDRSGIFTSYRIVNLVGFLRAGGNGNVKVGKGGAS
jgi:hypothetical protein